MNDRIRFGALLLAGSILVFASLSTDLKVTEACNKQCANATKCGDQTFPPGWVNLGHCASKESGDSCSYCAGNDHLRPCASSVCANDKKCIENSNGDCGAKYNGKCFTFTGSGVVLTCKETGASAGTCSNIVVCTGTQDDAGCN